MASTCRVIVLLAIMSLLSACAATNSIPLDRARAGTVKTIGIVTPDIPNNATSYIAATPGQSFGLIGALIDAGIQADREKRLEAILRNQQFAADQIFREGLAESVRRQGYTVVMVPVSRVKAKEFLERYPAPADTSVDAYLDVISRDYGYMAAGIQKSAPYRPFMYVDCKLVSAKDSAVLMQDRVVYNPLNPAKSKDVTIAPDPKFMFGSSEAMEATPEHVAEGLRVALAQTAAAVSNLLR